MEQNNGISDNPYLIVMIEIDCDEVLLQMSSQQLIELLLMVMFQPHFVACKHHFLEGKAISKHVNEKSLGFTSICSLNAEIENDCH